MSQAARAIHPEYVRLSGEIADQAILDNLGSVFPHAKIAHAFASTEAGLAFDVGDGLAGFPAALIERGNGAVEMKIQDGSLCIRSPRAAIRYLGQQNPRVADEAGFVDTGDVLELRGNRYYFVGRRDGVINVGGLKVHPEEIEAVINRHPRVRGSLVRKKKNPITGAVVVAEVALWAAAENGHSSLLQQEILNLCRETLPPHKVPAAITFLKDLPVAMAGKLVRPRA
jgi:acyl-coenzyme A synthetase/AMP-(fatty) acid ligase